MKDQNDIFNWTEFLLIPFFNKPNKLKSKYINKAWDALPRSWQHIWTGTKVAMPNIMHETIHMTYKVSQNIRNRNNVFCLFFKLIFSVFQPGTSVVHSIVVVKDLLVWNTSLNLQTPLVWALMTQTSTFFDQNWQVLILKAWWILFLNR